MISLWFINLFLRLFGTVNSFPVHHTGQRLVKIKNKTTATNHQRKRKWDPLQSVKATQYASIGHLQVQFSVAGRYHCSWCQLNENKFDLKTKWSVKKILLIVCPEHFFFFFGTIHMSVIGRQININIYIYIYKFF